MQLFQHQQFSSGADLAKLFVEALHKSKTSVNKDIVANLTEIMAKIPRSAPERQTFIMTALRYHMKLCDHQLQFKKVKRN